MLKGKAMMGCKSLFICLVLIFFGTSRLQVAAEEAVSESEAEAQNLLKELVKEKSIKDQEKSVLIKEHIKAGLSYYKEGDLTKSKEEYKSALSLDPDNKQARAGFAKVEASWNKEMEGLYNQGLKFYKKKDFSPAEETWSKIPPESSYYKKAQGFLEEIRPAKEVSAEIKIQETPSKTKTVKPKKETDALEKGIQAFKSEDYQSAIDNFNTYLTQNPTSQEAKDWLDLAERKLEREKEKASVQEQMQKITEEKEIYALKRDLQEKEMLRRVDEKYLPPKREEGLAGAIEGGRERQISEDEKKRRDLEAKIKSITVPAISFSNAPIQNVIEQLADMTGVNLFLDPTALEEGAGGYTTSTVETTAEERPALPPSPLGLNDPMLEARARALAAERPAIQPVPTTTTTTTSRTGGLKVSFRTVAPLSLWALLYNMLKIIGLDFRVEPELIRISTPARLASEAQVTRTYRLKYGVRKTRTVELKEFEERTD